MTAVVLERVTNVLTYLFRATGKFASSVGRTLCVIYVVVTCEIKLFQTLFHLTLFQNYFRDLLQLMNVFQHVQCR